MINYREKFKNYVNTFGEKKGAGSEPKHKKALISEYLAADLSADMPENRLIKLKIILKHSRML